MPEYNIVHSQAFTVTDFFTSGECDAHIALAESIGFSDAPINSMLGPQVRKDVRNNTRVMLDDGAKANELWTRIRDYVPLRFGNWLACGVNERLRFYRYEVGQQFDWHYDGCFERENGERSQLTFMVYLNEGFQGGETSLEHIDVKPQEGMALLFVHQIRHKGQPVLEGRKYVLRTDVMYQWSPEQDEDKGR